jgi:hypothetical protein
MFELFEQRDAKIVGAIRFFAGVCFCRLVLTIGRCR